MGLRILIDENASPRIPSLLADAGHEAVHVLDVLAASASDEQIARYAVADGYAVLTNDEDFLDDEQFPSVRVLYYPDDSIGAEELARRVRRLGERVDGNEDLARVTFLGEW